MSSAISVVPVKLKYLYWIGPVGTLQFVLTGCVHWAAPGSDPRAPRRSRLARLAGH